MSKPYEKMKLRRAPPYSVGSRLTRPKYPMEQISKDQSACSTVAVRTRTGISYRAVEKQV